jgi:hypothetical protein
MARAAAMAVFLPDHTGGVSAEAEATMASGAEAAAGGTAGMVVVRAHGIGAVSSARWADAGGADAGVAEAGWAEAGWAEPCCSWVPEGWSGCVMVAPREFGL